jgi:hypothetical protein
MIPILVAVNLPKKSETMETITFTKKYTIEQFKSISKCSKIDIIKNPHTGKIFFSAGDFNGKVSKKGYANPVISLCTDDKGETFYMLHSDSSDNVLDSL